MPDYGELTNYILRFSFFLLAITAAGAAVFLVASGIGIVLLMIISFFSLIIAARFNDVSIELGDYSLDLGHKAPEGFDGLIEHVSKSSDSAARSLEQIKNRSSSGDPFHELSLFIDKGIDNFDRTAADRLLSELKAGIDTLRYVNEFEETEMKVVRFKNDILYVNSSGKEEFLKKRMKFRIYRETVQISNETAEDVTDTLGIAAVELASKGTTKMRVERWLTRLDSQDVSEIRNNELNGKKLYVDVLVPESAKETPIEDLEQAYQQLKPIRTEV